MLQWNFPSFKTSKLDHKFIYTRFWFCFYTRLPGTREQERKFSDVSASDSNNYDSFAFLRKSWKDRASEFRSTVFTSSCIWSIGMFHVVFIFMSYLYVLRFYILYLPSTVSRREKIGVRCDWAKLMNSNNLQARELLEVSPLKFRTF